MIDTQEPRSLVREIQRDLAPVVAYIASTDKQLRDWGLRKDLGAPFQKLVKADLISHQQLKSSVAAACRLLAKIDDDLFAIETGRRRPARASHPIAGVAFMRPAAGRLPGPFEVTTSRRTLH